MVSTDQLWGGRLAALRFDPTRRVLELAIDVHRDGLDESWSVRLEGVSELRIDRPDDEWDYTEVTELHADEGAQGGHLEMVFWTEPNGLRASFSVLAVNQMT
ncbi:MAG TPA: hypothetical protein VHD81_01615 [Mycobacteriales bacterium]|nr:hypothetical protein [Mycobacteriales bacterium]